MFSSRARKWPATRTKSKGSPAAAAAEAAARAVAAASSAEGEGRGGGRRGGTVAVATVGAPPPLARLDLRRDLGRRRRCRRRRARRRGLLRHRADDPLHAQPLRHAHGPHLDRPRALHDVHARVRDGPSPQVLQQVAGLQAAELGVGVLVVPDDGRRARLDVRPRGALAEVVEDRLDRVHPLLLGRLDQRRPVPPRRLDEDAVLRGEPDAGGLAAQTRRRASPCRTRRR